MKYNLATKTNELLLHATASMKHYVKKYYAEFKKKV